VLSATVRSQRRSVVYNLNGDIPAVMRKDRPNNAREFICQRYNRRFAECSLDQALEPTAEWGLTLGEPWQVGARPKDQQCPQVCVAAFVDAGSFGFASHNPPCKSPVQSLSAVREPA